MSIFFEAVTFVNYMCDMYKQYMNCGTIFYYISLGLIPDTVASVTVSDRKSVKV